MYNKYANGLVVKSKPKSHISEAFRTLRTNIELLNSDKKLKTILMTSPVPQKGIEVTAVNFALTIAESGKKVIIVDCDLRMPLIHTLFDSESKPGLTNVLVLDIKISEVIRKAEAFHSNLSYITAGPVPPNPSGLLISKKMKEIFEELKNQADTIIFLSAPIIGFVDSLELANRADGVILVLNAGEVSQKPAKQTKVLLERAKAKILGVILNNVDIKQINQYQYYHQNSYKKYFNQ